jgi:hypothetical protein
MIADGKVVFVNARANVRCPACGWYTSRAPKADGDYGACLRCAGVLQPSPRREYFRRAQPVPRKPRVSHPANASPTRYRTQYATWPELVAAELQGREEEPR